MKFDPSNPNYRSVRSRFREAFMESFNVIGLAGFAAVSAATLNPVPLLVGLVAEAAYLLFVPDTAWFTKRLEAKFDGEIKAHRLELKQRVFPRVRLDVKEKFVWLEQARMMIENSSATVQDKWFREALRKLDFLLEKYLEFAERESEYLNYLFTLSTESASNFSDSERKKLPPVIRHRDDDDLPPSLRPISEADVRALIDAIQSYYEREIKALEAQAETETVFATKEILTKRRDVLKRRRDFVVRLADMLINLRHQMELIAETFGLINDEMRARSPEQVLADIDEVVGQATSLTDALDSVTPLDQLVTESRPSL